MYVYSKCSLKINTGKKINLVLINSHKILYFRNNGVFVHAECLLKFGVLFLKASVPFDLCATEKPMERSWVRFYIVQCIYMIQ